MKGSLCVRPCFFGVGRGLSGPATLCWLLCAFGRWRVFGRTLEYLAGTLNLVGTLDRRLADARPSLLLLAASLAASAVISLFGCAAFCLRLRFSFLCRLSAPFAALFGEGRQLQLWVWVRQLVHDLGPFQATAHLLGLLLKRCVAMLGSSSARNILRSTHVCRIGHLNERLLVGGLWHIVRGLAFVDAVHDSAGLAHDSTGLGLLVAGLPLAALKLDWRLAGDLGSFRFLRVRLVGLSAGLDVLAVGILVGLFVWLGFGVRAGLRLLPRALLFLLGVQLFGLGLGVQHAGLSCLADALLAGLLFGVRCLLGVHQLVKLALGVQRDVGFLLLGLGVQRAGVGLLVLRLLLAIHQLVELGLGVQRAVGFLLLGLGVQHAGVGLLVLSVRLLLAIHQLVELSLGVQRGVGFALGVHEEVRLCQHAGLSLVGLLLGVRFLRQLAGLLTGTLLAGLLAVGLLLELGVHQLVGLGLGVQHAGLGLLVGSLLVGLPLSVGLGIDVRAGLGVRTDTLLINLLLGVKFLLGVHQLVGLGFGAQRAGLGLLVGALLGVHQLVVLGLVVQRARLGLHVDALLVGLLGVLGVHQLVGLGLECDVRGRGLGPLIDAALFCLGVCRLGCVLLGDVRAHDCAAGDRVNQLLGLDLVRTGVGLLLVELLRVCGLVGVGDGRCITRLVQVCQTESGCFHERVSSLCRA